MALYKETKQAQDGRTIQFTVNYSKERKAYRVTAVPIKETKLSNGLVMIEVGAYTGFNDTLLEVERQSPKRLDAAITLLGANMEKYMAYFNNKSNV